MRNYQRDHFINEVYKMALLNKKIFFLSADFGAPALDIFRKKLPNQFYHVGISEQNMINIAIGLAREGMIVFTYAMSPFITMRCAEQHKICALMQLPVISLVAGVGVGYADAGPTHYSTEDYSLLTNFIGSNIYTLSDCPISKIIAKQCIKNKNLTFIRIDRDICIDLPKGEENMIKHGFRKFFGGRICIITHGYMVSKIFEIIKKNKLEKTVLLIDLFKSKPLSNLFIKEINKYENLLFVDEQIQSSALGLFINQYVDKKFNKKIKFLNLNENYIFENGGREYLLKKNGISKDIILDKILSF